MQCASQRQCAADHPPAGRRRTGCPGRADVATVLALLMAAAGGAACGGKNKAEKTTEAVAEKTEEPKAPGPDPGLCDVIGKRVVLFDLNRDRVADVWKVYTRTEEGDTRLEVLSCKQVDFDHDGRKDYVVEYDAKGGKRVERFDFDFDGRFDAVLELDERSGKPSQVKRDSNFDGRFDLTEAYDDGVLESVERDRNADGAPDHWEQYVRGTLVAILYDDDFDQKIDRREEVDTGEGSAAWPEDGDAATADPGAAEASGDDPEAAGGAGDEQP